MSSVEEWCKKAFEESEVARILLQHRGGKLKDACAAFEGLLKDKKADAKKKLAARKLLKEALDSAQEGIDKAAELIERGDGIIDILKKKHDAAEVEKKCKKATDELKAAKDFQKDIKPIMEKSKKLLKDNP